MRLTLPHIDLLSFIFGFVLGTILWVIIGQFSKLAPKIKENNEEKRLHREHQKALDQEHGIRSFTLHQAQNLHLACNLFPLNSILVEPKVILPVKYLPQGDEEIDYFAQYKVIPDIPEMPEIYANFPALKTSLLSLVKGKQQYIAVSAAPGHGKTTALADLASQLCSVQTPEGSFQFCPLFLDYGELSQDGIPAVTSIVEHLLANIKGLNEQSLIEILNHANKDQRLVFMIDGIDRYPISEQGRAINWLKEIQKQFSRSYVVISCDPFVQGDIHSLGFEVFSLSPWTKADRDQFISLWKTVWSMVQPNFDQQKLERICRWLSQEENFGSPLELTIRVWASLAGTITGIQGTNLITDYLFLSTGGNLKFSTVTEIAAYADPYPYPMISKEKLEEVLARQSRSTEVEEISPSGSYEKVVDPLQKMQQGIEFLEHSHFLTKIHQDSYSFSYLPLFSALLSKKNVSQPVPAFLEVAASPTLRILFEDKLISQNNFDEVNSWLSNQDSPIYRDVLFTQKWLKQTDKEDPLRQKIFKTTARVLQDKTLPVGLRYRFLPALIETQDPSIPSLFSYFASSQDPAMRMISAFGSGLLEDPKLVPVLTKLSKDIEIDVQKTACFALNRIWNQPAQAALVDLIFNADEDIRCLICQLISVHEPEGIQVLQELTETDNYLARKAAITGLALVDQPWVPGLLEKVSTRDSQWVVRDAARFVIEHPLAKEFFAARNSVSVLENPWTIKQSQDRNIELPDTGIPTKLLYSILENGDFSDKQIALDYLLLQPDQKLILTLLSEATNTDSDIRDLAGNALYRLSKSGFNLKNK